MINPVSLLFPLKNNFGVFSPTDPQVRQNYERFYGDKMGDPVKESAQTPNTTELIRRERMMLQQYQDMKKLYSYNIISNTAQLKYAPVGSRFSASIKNSYSFESPEMQAQRQNMYPQSSSGLLVKPSNSDPSTYKPNYNLNNNIFFANAGQALSCTKSS